MVTSQTQHSTNEGVLRSNSPCSMLMSKDLRLPRRGLEPRLSGFREVSSMARPLPLYISYLTLLSFYRVRSEIASRVTYWVQKNWPLNGSLLLLCLSLASRGPKASFSQLLKVGRVRIVKNELGVSNNNPQPPVNLNPEGRPIHGLWLCVIVLSSVLSCSSFHFLKHKFFYQALCTQTILKEPE